MKTATGIINRVNLVKVRKIQAKRPITSVNKRKSERVCLVKVFW